MNSFNEISFLSKLVKPDIAIITNISEAHIGNFNSIRDIIKAKVEIFDGLKTNGYILVGLYNRYGRLRTVFRQYLFKLFGKRIVMLLDPILRNIKKGNSVS